MTYVDSEVIFNHMIACCSLLVGILTFRTEMDYETRCLEVHAIEHCPGVVHMSLRAKL